MITPREPRDDTPMGMRCPGCGCGPTEEHRPTCDTTTLPPDDGTARVFDDDNATLEFKLGYRAGHAAGRAEILWECDGCGFEFHRHHDNADGSGYSCPVCESAEQSIEIASLRKQLAAERERCAKSLERRAEYLKHASHHDGLGMGDQRIEQELKDRAAAIREGEK